MSVARKRDGVGIFFVVIITLVVLVAFIGIFQMTFSRQVVDQVAKSSIGEVALILAESASNEALLQIRQAVNDQDSRYYNLFRKEVLSEQAGSFPIEVELPETNKLFEQKHYKRFFLDGFEAKVLFQRQFSQVPYERYGVIELKATVGTNLSLTEKVVRTIRTGCEFKIVLIGPPRPFDQVTFMVTESNSLVRDANYRVQESSRELENATKDKKDFLDLLNSERGSLTTLDVDKAIQELNKVNIPSKVYIDNRVHEFKEPLTVLTVQETVDLKEVALLRRLEDATRAVADIADDYRRARERLESNLGSEVVHETYRTTLSSWVDVHKERIETVRTFQNYFVEYSDPARQELSRFYYKLDKSEWQRKAFYTIKESFGNVNGQLDELRQKLKPLNGIVFIDNPNQTLNLEGAKGNFQGRVILAVNGNVNIGGPPGTVSGGDLLTVVCYGSLSVDGLCRASLIANSRVSVGPSSRINGNLVIKEVRDISALQGTIIKDPRLYSGRTVPGDTSGAYTDYYYVALGPGETFRIIGRK